MSYDTLKEQVEFCLENFPGTRNSDIRLTIMVWKRFHPQVHYTTKGRTRDFIYLDDLYDLPREDNIKRIRAQFNQKGLFHPTVWEIAKKRNIKQSEWKGDLGYRTKEEAIAESQGKKMDEEFENKVAEEARLGIELPPVDRKENW